MTDKGLCDSLAVKSILSECGIVCERGVAERVSRYLDLLEKWNRKMSLTGFKERQDMVRDLFAESFLASRLLEAGDGPLLDVGSGAGFPGMALKIYRPELPVYLLEPRKKRASFLECVRREVGLEGVVVVCKRLEECQHRDFAVLARTVTVRGVGGVADKLARCQQLTEGNGKVVLFTSRRLWEREREGLAGMDWSVPIQVPWSEQRLVVSGVRQHCST